MSTITCTKGTYSDYILITVTDTEGGSDWRVDIFKYTIPSGYEGSVHPTPSVGYLFYPSTEPKDSIYYFQYWIRIGSSYYYRGQDSGWTAEQSSSSSSSSSISSSSISSSSISSSSISSISSMSMSSLSSSSASSSSASSVSSISSSSFSSSSSSSSVILTTSSTSSFYSDEQIFENKKGILVNNDLSMDLQNTTNENSIDVQVTLFSNKFSYADIEFLYRADYGDEWLTDASISGSTAKFINGNKLFRLPCSSSGYNNIIRWEYEKNRLTTGNSCQIKIKAIPSVSVFNNYGYYTIIENAYSGIYNEIESIVPYKILGIDNYGRYMCFNNNQFVIVDRNKNIIMQYYGVKNIICAQQIFNDNYIVLDNDDKKIIEMSKDGALIYELQSAILFSNPYYFMYDKYLNNILLTDNKKHITYDISWNDEDKGSIIWQHGGFGTGIYNLNYPTAAVYDSENRAIIWIADSGNKRIKKIDRSSCVDVISVYNYFIKDGINIGFNPISRMFSNNDELILIEQNPEQEFFNTNINLHPTLARAMDLKQDGILNKNNLKDYENLLFKPITEIIDL